MLYSDGLKRDPSNLLNWRAHVTKILYFSIPRARQML